MKSARELSSPSLKRNNSKCTIRPYEDGERGVILDLFRDVWGDQSYQNLVKLWDWQNCRNPFSERPKIIVAEINNRIVGSMTAIPVRIIIDSKEYDAYWQVDSVVHSEYRGMGIGGSLIEALNRSAPLCMAKGTSPAMHRLRKEKGFYDISPSNYLFRFFDARKFMGRKFSNQKVVSTGTFLINKIFNLRVEGGEARSFEEIKDFGDDFDTLWKNVSRKLNLIVKRDSRYLTWRYLEHPGNPYRIFRSIQGGETVGYIVSRIHDQGDRRVGWIVDLLCDPDDRETAKNLITGCLEALSLEKADEVFGFVTNVNLRRRLFFQKFISSFRTPQFMAYSTRLSRDRLMKSKSWFVTHGDCDTEFKLI